MLTLLLPPLSYHNKKPLVTHNQNLHRLRGKESIQDQHPASIQLVQDGHWHDFSVKCEELLFSARFSGSAYLESR